MSTAEKSSEVVVAQRNPWLVLAVLLAGALMTLLDASIVNVAPPTIRTSLGVPTPPRPGSSRDMPWRSGCYC